MIDLRKQADAVKKSANGYEMLDDSGREYVDRMLARTIPSEALDAQLAASQAGLAWLYDLAFRGMSTNGAHATPVSLNCHLHDLDGLMVLSYAPDLKPVDQILNVWEECIKAGRTALSEQLSDPSVLEAKPAGAREFPDRPSR